VFGPPKLEQLATHIVETIVEQKNIAVDKLGRSRFDLQLLMRELAVQAPQQPADELVRALLLQVAGALNPYLPPSRLMAVWDHLASQPGYNALSEATREWFALHRAIGLRDADSMAKLAQHLIETVPKEELSPEEATYVLTAGLTGYLRMKDLIKAKALLETFGNHQQPIRQPSMYLQLLLWQVSVNP
jgi:hypothetical protein